MARILVIEDDAATAQEIVTELGTHGHETVHADNGDMGLEKATREPFDLITLDRMLPGIDGLMLVERLRVLQLAAVGHTRKVSQRPARASIAQNAWVRMLQ